MNINIRFFNPRHYLSYYDWKNTINRRKFCRKKYRLKVNIFPLWTCMILSSYIPIHLFLSSSEVTVLPLHPFALSLSHPLLFFSSDMLCLPVTSQGTHLFHWHCLSYENTQVIFSCEQMGNISDMCYSLLVFNI